LRIESVADEMESPILTLTLDNNNMDSNIVNSALSTIVNETAGSQVNVALQAYRYIRDNVDDNKHECLHWLCSIWKRRRTSDKAKLVPNVISDVEERVFKKDYGDVVDKLVSTLVVQAPEPREFYNDLWSGVVDNTFFRKSENTSALALHRILESNFVPYFYLDKNALRMSDKEFSAKSDDLAESVAKIKFILNRPNTQGTEDADQLLRVLDAHDREEDKIVLLVHATQHRVDNLFHRMLENMAQSGGEGE
jgi:hypothetical protein